MEVHGFQPLPVIDPNGIAEHVELFCEGDGAGSNSANRFTFRGALIHAAVIFAGRLAVVQTFYAERRSHASADRSSQRILPHTIFRNVFFERVEQRHLFGSGTKRFDFRAELHVLRRENSFANKHTQGLGRSIIAAKDGELEHPGLIQHGNREKAKPLPVGLEKELRFAVVEPYFCEFRRTSNAKCFAKLHLRRRYGALLREYWKQAT